MCEFCNTKFYVQVERYSKPILAPLTEVEELECELINKTGFQYMQIQNNYCPLCRKEAGRVNEEEELDIPVKSLTKQLELGICMECEKRKAKYLCDYITGKTFDLYGKGQIKESTCDKYLCEKCTNKLNKRDYCKKHIKQLKEELKEESYDK